MGKERLDLFSITPKPTKRRHPCQALCWHVWGTQQNRKASALSWVLGQLHWFDGITSQLSLTGFRGHDLGELNLSSTLTDEVLHGDSSRSALCSCLNLSKASGKLCCCPDQVLGWVYKSSKSAVPTLSAKNNGLFLSWPKNILLYVKMRKHIQLRSMWEKKIICPQSCILF